MGEKKDSEKTMALFVAVIAVVALLFGFYIASRINSGVTLKPDKSGAIEKEARPAG